MSARQWIEPLHALDKGGSRDAVDGTELPALRGDTSERPSSTPLRFSNLCPAKANATWYES
jgi:hypothetical protein